MADPDIKPGDWVRFKWDGRFVIGVVQGVALSTYGWWNVRTDIGLVKDTDVVEVRRG